MDRATRVMTSDIHRLIVEAEEPEAAIEGLMAEIDTSIVELRREMVMAIARRNRLRYELLRAEESASQVERQASLALARGNEVRARHLLGREIGALKARDALEVELTEAARATARLVATLIRMEDQAQIARRTRDDVARRRRAGATPCVGRTARISPGSPAFDAYAEAVRTLEREASRPGGPDGGGGC
jgi:phage shock protein A